MELRFQINWLDNLAFQAEPPTGHNFILDGTQEGERRGPYPTEALVASLAACGGMDVVSILKKKRVEITSYRIEVVASRPDTEEFPKPFTKIEVKHFVSGPNVNEADVSRALELSVTKYCKVLATLELGPEIVSTYEIL